MEICEVILHTNGGKDYLVNGTNYPVKGNEVLSAYYGVNSYYKDKIAEQFYQTAKFFNNQDKTPLFHYVTSFTSKTAPTAEKALELTDKIFAPITENHLAVVGIHHKERGDSSYHSHTVVCPTNVYDGSMMYADNSTLFPIAQRVADVTQQKCRLVVKPEDKTKKEFHKVFVQHTDNQEE